MSSESKGCCGCVVFIALVIAAIMVCGAYLQATKGG